MDLNLNLSKKAYDLIIKFEYISIFISLIGSLLLYIHLNFFVDFILYEIAINIFQAGLMAGVCSFCFGVFFNEMKK